jgi:hypothetical protein
VDDNRIRRRIAEIDQHIAVLMKERDELIFAERVLERLSEGAAKSSPAPAAAPKSAEVADEDGIEEALAKLENKVGLS